ncbi:MAG: 5'-3' exonuclease [Thermobispora bispora]|nr:flap endonuclease [Actinomycetales bacterium]MBX6166375.1 5'-3' exonuclease [Thermobispora bispora]QSI48330.1 5'-3' exonuclease [Thermobispora bispora]
MRRDPGAPQQNERVLMLLDTPSLYFRAFHGVPESVTAPDGTPVNAVRGLIDMITTLVRRRSPAGIAACMDADWRPAFRVAVLPAYKAHRVAADGVTEQVPEALTAQLPVIEQVLDAVGIARIGVPGYEADDVIGTLTARATGAVEIVTGDRDLFQLVDDAKPCRVLYTARGVRALQVVDEAFITERYGIPGRSYADFALLRGDPSDGLPGVPGIGERTAAALISRFGTLSALRAALDEGEPGAIPAAARAKLLAAREYLDAAEVVVRVAADAPVPDTDLTLPRAPRDPELLVTLSERYGLDGPLGRLLDALGAG